MVLQHDGDTISEVDAPPFRTDPTGRVTDAIVSPGLPGRSGFLRLGGLAFFGGVVVMVAALAYAARSSSAPVRYAPAGTSDTTTQVVSATPSVLVGLVEAGGKNRASTSAPGMTATAGAAGQDSSPTGVIGLPSTTGTSISAARQTAGTARAPRTTAARATTGTEPATTQTTTARATAATASGATRTTTTTTTGTAPTTLTTTTTSTTVATTTSTALRSASTTATTVAATGYPEARDDTLVVKKGKEEKIKVLDNDKPGSSALDVGTLTIVLGPVHASSFSVKDGQLKYKASKDYTGSDRLTYRICNTDKLCATASVNVTITS